MKTLQATLIILTIACTPAFSAKDHDHKAIPAPKGGKVLETTPLHAEFFVQPDKKVSITFYDENMKPIAPGEQVVKVIAEVPSGKATLDFEKVGDAFVSTTALPEGEGYRIVVQIKQTADAKPQNFRIDYHTEICGECKLAEYACICEDHSGPRSQRSRALDLRMSPELERFAENRIQRRMVIEVIAAAGQPFTARSLWEMVKKRDALASRARVYRTLRLLRESELVRMTVLPSPKISEKPTPKRARERIFERPCGRFFATKPPSAAVQGLRMLLECDSERFAS